MNFGEYKRAAMLTTEQNEMKDLVRLFDAATFESGVVGIDNPYNAISHTDYSYPSLNGWSASVVEVDTIIILERQERTVSGIIYEYAELDTDQLAEIQAIEYDPYNSALYARTLLDFADAILDD